MIKNISVLQQKNFTRSEMSPGLCMKTSFRIRINADFTLDSRENNENAVLICNNKAAIDFCNLSLRNYSLLYNQKIQFFENLESINCRTIMH